MAKNRSIRIGLTNFLRFISATGLTKIRSAEEALQDYRDWKDYYRDLREVMLVALQTRDWRRLETFLVERTVDDRSPHFSICGNGLIAWMKKTDYTFVGFPTQGKWQVKTLRVSVNPEVILKVDGVEYVVKLYLAKGTLSQPAQRAFAWLVREVHGSLGTPALLEVRKQRLTPAPKPNGRIARWIRLEAQSFLNYVEKDDHAA